MLDLRHVKGAYLHPVNGEPLVPVFAAPRTPMVLCCYAETKCVYGLRFDSDSLRLLDTGILLSYDAYRKDGLGYVVALLGNKLEHVSTSRIFVNPSHDLLGTIFTDLLLTPWPNEVCSKPVPHQTRQYVPDYVSRWRYPP